MALRSNSGQAFKPSVFAQTAVAKAMALMSFEQTRQDERNYKQNLKQKFKKIFNITLALLPIFFISFSIGNNKTADLLIYSYNRPLQLYALLESLELLVTGIDTIHIIYKTTSERFDNAYDKVHQNFRTVQFIKQNNDINDFKVLTLRSLSSFKSDYVLFAVDDDIITDHIDISECIDTLEKTQAYAFFFRLGKNINSSYPFNNAYSPAPPLAHIGNNIFKFQFNAGTYDWNYPNNVDLTLYRKSDLDILYKINYSNPNQLEAAWAGKRTNIKNPSGLCFVHSKMINIPINKVQNVFNNRFMNAASIQYLLERFDQGFKIDISKVFKFNNNAAHTEYMPEFIAREN